MENYIVSARKYRPSTFRSVVGQHALTQTLKNAIQSNKLAHAYLFCGPRGVGKTSCARIFAKTINCLTPTEDKEACSSCESCRAFDEQRSYNIHELDAASNNSVDDIRLLIEQVRIPPAIGKYKVFIIDEVHMLSTAAFNAFLKTLEEPPKHAVFILATTEKHKVLPTILSRCQIYDFTRITISDIVEHLQYVAKEESVMADADALNVIAQKADGGMRDALSIFDQVVSFTNGNISYQAVIDNLNVLDYEYYFRLTDALLNGRVKDCMLILNEVLSMGFDGQNVATGLASHFRDLLVCKDEETLVLFEVGASIRERYKQMSKLCADHFLFAAIERMNSCDINYRASRNKRLLLELTLIQICQQMLPAPPAPAPSGGQKVQGAPQQTPQSAPPQTAQTAAPQTAQSGVNESPAAYAPAVSVPKIVVPSAPPPKVAANRPPGSPMISRSLKEMRQGSAENKNAANAAASMAVERTEAFTEETLLRAWDAYADALTTKVHLKQAMLNCKPVLKDNFLFEVALFNPGQEETLQSEAAALLSHLREQLKNTKIQMHTHVSEQQAKRSVYTPEEKYFFLQEKNPLLGVFRETFKLKLY